MKLFNSHHLFSCLRLLILALVLTATADYSFADYNVTISSAANVNGVWSGTSPRVWTPNGSGANVSTTDIETELNVGNAVVINTAGGVAENGDILLNTPVTWSVNSSLMLSAWRNISIYSAIAAPIGAQLELRYGQGAVAADNTATYTINAPVNLPAGNSFSTKLGNDGITVNYTVFTSLGVQESTTGTDLQGMQGNLSGKYALGADIDASVTSTWGGTGFTPVGLFSGTFDGLGHTINGLYINRSASNTGLFGQATATVLRPSGLAKGTPARFCVTNGATPLPIPTSYS